MKAKHSEHKHGARYRNIFVLLNLSKISLRTSSSHFCLLTILSILILPYNLHYLLNLEVTNKRRQQHLASTLYPPPMWT